MAARPRPSCKTCGKPCMSKGYSKIGTRQWATVCTVCRSKARGGRCGNDRKPYRKHKGAICSFCGFVPVHSCQLDVDHIDGNHKNNAVENLQTLCANCHRLKTRLCGDHITRLE